MNVILDIRQATNSELLSRFEEGRDQAAFAEIVRRHGSMVRQTAWRVTRSIEDSEDAFQAAFFALAKSAHRIRDNAALAGWLHRAALLSALRIQRANMNWDQRGEEMRQRYVADENSPSAEVTSDEVRRILDKEVAALPRKLQRAIVLCDLEGRSRTEAAKELGLPRSTVDSHVNKGRTILRQRMARLGISLPAGGYAAFTTASVDRSMAMGAELIEETTSNATLFAAGKDATEIGVSQTVVNVANGVVAKLSTASFVAFAFAAILLSVVVAYASTINSGASTGSAGRGLIFVDSFEDRNASDGRPVRWMPAPFLAGSVDASSGNLVLSPTMDTHPQFGFAVGLPDLSSHDSSIRTEVRVTANGGAALVELRGNSTTETKGYFASLAFIEELGGSVFVVGRHEGVGQQHFFDSSSGEGFVVLPYDVRKSFTVVQLDAIGSEIRAWTWKSGDEMPDKPHFKVTDSTFESGFPSLGVGNNLSSDRTQGASKAIYRLVQFANMPIEEIPNGGAFVDK